MHIVSYVTCLMSKQNRTRAVSKKSGQASKELEVNIKLENSVSQLDNQDSYNQIVDNFLPILESKLVLCSSKLMEKIFCKRKRGLTSKDIGKQSKKIKTEA